jgi:predicted glycoside hydrolase/deacetylase ChbG (UPF0249 family)
VTDSLSNPPEALIVTADDFGFGVATSRGIVRAHQAGVVTSTSMMVVTGDHAAASVPLLEDAPKLEVGLHLVLTGRAQQPLIAGKSSGLVGRDGGFHPLGKLMWQAWRRRLDANALFDEICAQARKCEALLGRRPAYVDGHHHAHQLPVIREALVRAMQQVALPAVTRCTIEGPSVRAMVRGSGMRRAIMHQLGTAAQPVFKAAGVWSNDSCFGMIGTREMARGLDHDPNLWSAYLPHLAKSGVVEWFVHPGERDTTLVNRDSYIEQRATELESLSRLGSSPAWSKWAVVLTTKAAAVNKFPKTLI